MKNRPISETQLTIDGLGTFDPEIIRPEEGICCFIQRLKFRGDNIDLVVYPNEDGTWPTPGQQAELCARFQAFTEHVDYALRDLPSQLRELCEEYRIDISHLTDDEIIDSVKWMNVKLEREGDIECYTSNPEVTENLDVVIRFANGISINYVYFDG